MEDSLDLNLNKKGRGRPLGSLNKDKGGFTRYNPTKWEAWMTFLCIESNAGYSNRELALKYEITETHVSNLLCSDRASVIRSELKEKLIKSGAGELSELRSLASARLKKFLENSELETNAPIQYANTAARILQMTFPSSSSGSGRGDTKVDVTINQQNNLQQNVLSVNPEYMERIASGLEKSLKVAEIHAGAFEVKEINPSTSEEVLTTNEVRTLNKKVASG